MKLIAAEKKLFSLVEMAAVIAVMAIIFTISVPTFNTFFEVQGLKGSSITLKNMLDQARATAVSGSKNIAMVILQNELCNTGGETIGNSYAFRALRLCEVNKDHEFVKWESDWKLLESETVINRVYASNKLMTSWKYDLSNTVLKNSFNFPQGTGQYVTARDNDLLYAGNNLKAQIGINPALLNHIKFDYQKKSDIFQEFLAVNEKDKVVNPERIKANACRMVKVGSEVKAQKVAGTNKGGLLGIVFNSLGKPLIKENVTFFICRGQYIGGIMGDSNDPKKMKTDSTMFINISSKKGEYGEIISLNKFTGLSSYEEYE